MTHPSPEASYVSIAEVSDEARRKNPSSWLDQDMARDITPGGLPKRIPTLDRFDKDRVGVDSPASTAPQTAEAQTQPLTAVDEESLALGSLLQTLRRYHPLPREREAQLTWSAAEDLGSLLRVLRPRQTAEPVAGRPADLSRLIRPRRADAPLKHTPTMDIADADTLVLPTLVDNIRPVTPRSKAGPGRHRATQHKKTGPLGRLLHGLRR